MADGSGSTLLAASCGTDDGSLEGVGTEADLDVVSCPTIRLVPE